MRIGHASIAENGTARNGVAGDQTGKEVCIREYYDKNWKTILRCKNTTKAEQMAVVCEILCNNKHVGYDQNGRNSLHAELVKIDYNYSRLVKDCECDCSSYMTDIAECVLIFPEYVNGNAPTTSTMVNAFTKTGFFTAIPFTSKDELRRGDILVAPGSHTVMVLDDAPAKAKTNKSYSYGIDVSSCQGKIDWFKVKGDGIKFAILRSTKKNGSPDETFDTNFRNATMHGIECSCYKYSYAKTELEAKAEAMTVLNLLKDKKMTVWLDLEEASQLNSIGPAGVNKVAKAFIEKIKSAGLEVGIYCNQNWYTNVIDSELKSKYKFWIARYGKNTGRMDETYKPNKGEYIWQYTSKGRVNGIKGDVDLDVRY